MAIQGTYLVLKIAGEVVAETISVSLKAKVKRLDTTTQDSGLNSTSIAGKLRIRMSGTYLMASDGTNYNTLYGYVDGDEVGITFFRDGTQFLSGYGRLTRLSANGADSKENITGRYSIRYYPSAVDVAQTILTETGVEITTETGETLIIE